MEAVGVQFRSASKIYYFDAGNIPDLQKGDQVIVQTTRGMELGYVVTIPDKSDLKNFSHRLRPITRRATPHDRLQTEYFIMQEPKALRKCRDLIKKRNVAVKIIGAEYNFNGRRLTFYYRARKKVRTNKITEELADMFGAEIEMRAIGERDCAKQLGGIGTCGRPLCCRSWLTSFNPVSIKKAKLQNLSLSPMDIAGVCGRLLCCLNYESDFYEKVQKQMPRNGARLRTPYGVGEVIEQNMLKESVQVKLDDTTVVEVTLEELEQAAKEQPERKERDERRERRASSSSRRSKSRRRRKRRKKPSSNESRNQ